MNDIIRVGDQIKIIKPVFYIRCGYPMDVKEETEKVFSEYGKSVEQLMIDVGATTKKEWSTPRILDSPREPSLYKICRELAYAKCKLLKFGGKTRSLHTEEIPEFQGISSRVLEIKYVKTGEYYPSSFHHSYFDEPDYNPGGLNKQKTHKLVRCFLHSSPLCGDKWIEAVNIEKIIYKEEQ